MVNRKILFMLFVAMVFVWASSLFASDGKSEDESVAASQTEMSDSQDKKEQNSSEQSSEKVNINTANAIELSSGLHKIGPKLAAEIIRYREENGSFKSSEDLKKVKGIGEKIYELNKDKIVVGE